MDKLDKIYLEMAQVLSKASYAKRRQVGCLIVKDRSIIADGYNGTVSGFPNVCEDENGLTLPEVLHAETNALSKLTKSSQSSLGATLYTTLAPCLDCSKLIVQSGIARVVYIEEYKCTKGIELLKKSIARLEQIEL